MDYDKQQLQLLRKTKKSIYRVLSINGFKTTQSELAKTARHFGGSYATIPATQHRALEIVSKLYDPVPIPMASSATDLYNQNNLICACLLVLTPQPNYTDSSFQPPVFVSIANDLTYRTEIQHLVYSRLLEQLEKHSTITSTPRSDYESLYNLIKTLEYRLERIEHRLEVEDSDNETNG